MYIKWVLDGAFFFLNVITRYGKFDRDQFRILQNLYLKKIYSIKTKVSLNRI